MLDSRPRWMGLGPLALYGLHEARARALDARRKRHEGIDPIEARRAERARQRLKAAKAITFKECAETYIASHRAGWRNDKHKYQWSATLSTYAYPAIGLLPVQVVDTGFGAQGAGADLDGEARNGGPSPAARGKSYWISQGFVATAMARTRRVGVGIWTSCCPRAQRWRGVEHHAAPAYAALPAFLASLREREAVSARALEFLILTAGRTGEVIGARWGEIDLLDKSWTVPAGRDRAASKEYL